AGTSDYFSGFQVDKNVADDLLRDFGDENEANLKEALRYLTTGSFSAISSGTISSISQAEVQKVNKLNMEFMDNLPSSTIEDRPSRMPLPIRNLQE
ncbi:MAG TPA: hypothetical protein VF602_07110, partial [Pedobacter sp.]